MNYPCKTMCLKYIANASDVREHCNMKVRFQNSLDSLEDRKKLHRSSFTKKSLLNNVNTPNVRSNEIHSHDTQNHGKFRLPKSRTN